MSNLCEIAVEIKNRVNEHKQWREYYANIGLFYAHGRARAQEHKAQRELTRHIETCSICREAEPIR